MRKTEERVVSAFDRVQLRDVGDVYITQGGTEGLQVEAEEELLARIRTDVVEGRLVLSITGDWINLFSVGISQFSSGAVRFNLQVKQLTAVDVPGAGRVFAASLNGPALSVRLAGAGAIELAGLSIGALSVDLAGAGKIELKGRAESQEVHLSGAGNYQGLLLESNRGKVNVSGVGSASVNVKDELEVRISGLGGVKYSGEPKMKTTISGLGRLTKV